ncbi:hypothetical protein ACIBCO_11545 [Streptomyces violascens]|uniref:hypothetical protein n=1 Tax=Streptomyces violascens TaxID=67381 RepID=UPI003794AABD
MDLQLEGVVEVPLCLGSEGPQPSSDLGDQGEEFGVRARVGLGGGAGVEFVLEADAVAF